jgi:TIR domain
MAYPKDFIISYNKADRSWAEWIAWVLEAEKYTTIVQEWDFKPGGNFVVEMDNATKQCERTIAVMSQDYLDAEFTVPEWATQFAQDPKGLGRRLVPVRVAPCDISLCDSGSAGRNLGAAAESRRRHSNSISVDSMDEIDNPEYLRGLAAKVEEFLRAFRRFLNPNRFEQGLCGED